VCITWAGIPGANSILPNALNKLTHTCTHKIRGHSQKKKKKDNLLNYTQRAIWWNGRRCIYSLVSFTLRKWIFVTHPLTSVVALSLKKLTPPPSTGGFLHFTKVLSFYLCCCSPSQSIWLVRKPSRCSTSLILGGVSYTFTQLRTSERQFHPDRVIRVSSGRWSGSHSASLSQACYSNPGSYQADGWSSQLFPSLLQVPLCNWDLLSSLVWDQQVCWCLMGHSPNKPEMPSPGEKEVKTESPSPQKCYRNLEQRYGTLRLFRKEYLLACCQRIQIQSLSHKNKGFSPYIPLRAGYRSKKPGVTHIWLHATLLATSPSRLCELLHIYIL
jgi:hypothetical protein